jgi:hypothetical protein
MDTMVLPQCTPFTELTSTHITLMRFGTRVYRLVFPQLKRSLKPAFRITTYK